MAWKERESRFLDFGGGSKKKLFFKKVKHANTG